MIKIETVYTREEAIEILKVRGLKVEKREVFTYDGDIPIPFRQWQAWNPFKECWQPVDTVFRNAVQRASEELQKERLATMDLERFFN